MPRPKGSKNIGSQTVRELILKNGYNPINDMLKQLEFCEKGRERFDCAEKLASYIYPKLKSIELTGKDGEALEILTNIILIPAKGSDGWEVSKD